MNNLTHKRAVKIMVVLFVFQMLFGLNTVRIFAQEPLNVFGGTDSGIMPNVGDVQTNQTNHYTAQNVVNDKNQTPESLRRFPIESAAAPQAAEPPAGSFSEEAPTDETSTEEPENIDDTNTIPAAPTMPNYAPPVGYDVTATWYDEYDYGYFIIEGNETGANRSGYLYVNESWRWDYVSRVWLCGGAYGDRSEVEEIGERVEWLLIDSDPTYRLDSKSFTIDTEGEKLYYHEYAEQSKKTTGNKTVKKDISQKKYFNDDGSLQSLTGYEEVQEMEVDTNRWEVTYKRTSWRDATDVSEWNDKMEITTDVEYSYNIETSRTLQGDHRSRGYWKESDGTRRCDETFTEDYEQIIKSGTTGKKLSHKGEITHGTIRKTWDGTQYLDDYSTEDTILDVVTWWPNGNIEQSYFERTHDTSETMTELLFMRTTSYNQDGEATYFYAFDEQWGTLEIFRDPSQDPQITKIILDGTNVGNEDTISFDNALAVLWRYQNLQAAEGNHRNLEGYSGLGYFNDYGYPGELVPWKIA